MGALLELIKEAPPEDRKAAAEMLKPYLNFEKEEDYDLVPKRQPNRQIGLPEFKADKGIKKSLVWCRTYLLPKMPGVHGLNAGKGHHIMIDYVPASKWFDEHEAEIDWNQSLPL